MGIKAGEIFKPFYVADPYWRELFLLPPNAFKVWLYHYGRENLDNESWPSVALIASECDLNRKTVFEARRWLLEHGWLIKVRQFDVRGGSMPVFCVDKGRIPYTDKRDDPKNGTDEPVPFGTTGGIGENGTRIRTIEVESIKEEPTNVVPDVFHEISKPKKTLESEPVSVPKQNPKPQAFNPMEYAKTMREEAKSAEAMDSQPLVTKFVELSSHYRFKHGIANDDREWCIKAFKKLLARPETPEHVLNVMQYMSESPMYARGAKTVSNVHPWDWFCVKFDQIAAGMEADEEFIARQKAKLDKETATVVDAIANKEAAIQGAKEAPVLVTDPLWRETPSGKRELARFPRTVEERRSPPCVASPRLAGTTSRRSWCKRIARSAMEKIPAAHARSRRNCANCKRM